MKTAKYVSADEAVSHIPSHCHVHLSSVASVPHCLIQALCRRADAGDVTDLHFHHFHTEGPAPYSEPKYEGIFFEQGFFVGPNVRKNVNAGYADYLPVHLGESQKLYRCGFIKLGAALVNVSLPDKDGRVSLGTSVDCSVAAIESADLVIGVVNPNVPYALGDLVSLDKFDYLVEDNTPLVTASFAEPTPTEVIIGKNCAALVEDGDCIQMGIGALPNALAAQLGGHKNLGLHTEMFADGLLGLIKKGVINGACKKIDNGKVVASFLLGSQEVYSYIDNNPSVNMRDIGYTNDPYIICQNPHMKAINSAVEVDLTGQICADSIGTRIFSGTGGQLEFVRGASMSEGGKSITALASRTNKGQSKIVAQLNPGAGVVTPRPDAHWIVTEYGAVDLYGRSLQERAKLLISIAHPDDREMLDRQAFERFGPHWHNLSL
ncbi:MAG: acetyl-CoA hydrolase/transferase family protein [Bacteroidales bacterium]|nr:acetyl-CoA hydrolase/transferase family protein [Bacteroidales bacterium]MBQ5582692.1 acetyl-CoA hydrolase/transferase family protein [Bacteroidales bacterium]